MLYQPSQVDSKRYTKKKRKKKTTKNTDIRTTGLRNKEYRAPPSAVTQVNALSIEAVCCLATFREKPSFCYCTHRFLEHWQHEVTKRSMEHTKYFCVTHTHVHVMILKGRGMIKRPQPYLCRSWFGWFI